MTTKEITIACQTDTGCSMLDDFAGQTKLSTDQVGELIKRCDEYNRVGICRFAGSLCVIEDSPVETIPYEGVPNA